MADRKEFTVKTRKANRQNAFRDQFEAGDQPPRSRSRNFKWLESIIAAPPSLDCIEWPFAKQGWEDMGR